ncbi:VWA domain-containing protein [Streptomyces sp. NPDC091212]|uniref:VWA domain-containing protein n=1 Tax=Streptomyces sp. NPDC091212 TaxID=3155191 RepID=UPI003449C4AC
MLFRKKRAADTTPAVPAPAPSSLSLVPLMKSAAVSLEKGGVAGQRAAVYLVLDRSLSMSRHYASGAVQTLATQTLALSLHLDDDGVVPTFFFDTKSYPPLDVRLTHYQGVIADAHRRFGGARTMGGTHYTIAMRAVIEHYLRTDTTDPALVIFQTDGEPQDHHDTRAQLAAASKLPIFWSFVGFGPDRLPFLEQLDELPGRVVDNASYFHAGPVPTQLPDGDVYDGITREFGSWLPAARAAGLLP